MRSGASALERRRADRGRQAGCGLLHPLGDRGAGRLGDQQHPLGGRVGVERGQRVERGQPTDGLGQVAPTDAEHVRDADAGGVEQAADLLGAGAGLAATRPTGPRRTTLAKPSATPETIAVPQSGPMTSTPASCAARLSATSCSTGTPSLKTSTLRPAAIASAASATAYGPGTLMIASAGSGASARAAPMVRGGMVCASPDFSRRASAASTAATAAVSSASSVALSAMSSWSGLASPSGARPMPAASSRFSGVAIATSTALTPGRSPISRPTCINRTESAYTPLRRSTRLTHPPARYPRSISALKYFRGSGHGREDLVLRYFRTTGPRCQSHAFPSARGGDPHPVKPAPFGYADPTSVDEALDLLTAEGEGAKVLAGGQSPAAAAVDAARGADHAGRHQPHPRAGPHRG